jgi:antitoxin component of MazEF toxin-antitoxin module
MSKLALCDQETIMEKIRLQHRQLTLPAEIIEQAHLHHGDLLEVSYLNGAIILNLQKKSMLDYAGSCKGAWGNTPADIESTLAQDRASWDR